MFGSPLSILISLGTNREAANIPKVEGAWVRGIPSLRWQAADKVATHKLQELVDSLTWWAWSRCKSRQKSAKLDADTLVWSEYGTKTRLPVLSGDKTTSRLSMRDCVSLRGLELRLLVRMLACHAQLLCNEQWGLASLSTCVSDVSYQDIPCRLARLGVAGLNFQVWAASRTSECMLPCAAAGSVRSYGTNGTRRISSEAICRSAHCDEALLSARATLERQGAQRPLS